MFSSPKDDHNDYDDYNDLSEYEALSEKIGFASKDLIVIPSIEVAKDLLLLIKQANSLEAAEAVMKVVRFTSSGKTPDEREAKRICCEASQLARENFGGG